MRRSEIKKLAARYPKYVEWSQEDECYIGRCPDLFGGGVHGTDEASVYKKLCETAEEWVELLEGEGRPLPKESAGKYSGKFVVRIDPDLHKRLTLKAKASGESLNSFVARALRRAS
jgi:predicted HicB family RNase H-like nuclease